MPETDAFNIEMKHGGKVMQSKDAAEGPRSSKSAIPSSPANEKGEPMSSSRKPTVIVAGLGDTGALIATRLTRTCNVVGISTRPALVSGQELGTRLIDLPRWRRTYLIPYRRFRKLDSVDVIHGHISNVDFNGSKISVELANGSSREVGYDYFVIATGVSNGFWRHDRVEDLATIDTELSAINAELANASTIAVVGGGATGVSVADNLARGGNASVHLFHSGDEPLPGYHPSVRRWMARQLATDGVTVHPNHRAVVPEGFPETNSRMILLRGRPARNHSMLMSRCGHLVASLPTPSSSRRRYLMTRVSSSLTRTCEFQITQTFLLSATLRQAILFAARHETGASALLSRT